MNATSEQVVKDRTCAPEVYTLIVAAHPTTEHLWSLIASCACVGHHKKRIAVIDIEESFGDVEINKSQLVFPVASLLFGPLVMQLSECLVANIELLGRDRKSSLFA